MELREKLIVLRDEAGLSQQAVASQLGLSRQAITRWESGATVPTMDNLKSLAKIYTVSLDWLCNDDNTLEARYQTADENLPDEKGESGAIRKRKKVARTIAIVGILFCLLLTVYIIFQKSASQSKPMEGMPHRTFSSEDMERAEEFDFGW